MVILVLHECLYYRTKLNHSLINPNQLRFGGTPVWDNPYDLNHEMSIECEDDIMIPLRFEGTKSMFLTWSPTDEELNYCIHIDITSKREWEPATVNLQAQSTASYVPDNWNV
jgi:hypothetical protein